MDKYRKHSIVIFLLLLLILMLAACEHSDTPRPKYAYIEAVYGDMAVVTQGRGGVQERALVDIMSGEEIIPFGSYAQIRNVYNNMAVVRCGGRDGFIDREGILDIVSGEEVIPIGRYSRISLYSNGMAVVNVGGSSFSALIDIASGEYIIPVDDTFLITIRVNTDTGMAIVGNSWIGGELRVIDLASGEEIIPVGQYTGFGAIVDGMVTVTTNQHYASWLNHGVVDLTNGKEVIPVGVYHPISLRQNGLAIVNTHLEFAWCGECEEGICFRDFEKEDFPGRTFQCGRAFSLQGLIDLSSGEEILQIGKYVDVGDVLDGMAVVGRAGETGLVEQGLIDIASGEVIIPFGIYDRIRLFPGFIAFNQGVAGWWLDCIESVKLTYSGS